MKIRLIIAAALAAGSTLGGGAPAQAADFTRCSTGSHSPTGFACEQSQETQPYRVRHVGMWFNDVGRGSVEVVQQPDGLYRLEVCDVQNDAIRPTMRYEDKQFVVHSLYPSTEGVGNCVTRYTYNIRKWRGTWRDHGTEWFVWPVGA